MENSSPVDIPLVEAGPELTAVERLFYKTLSLGDIKLNFAYYVYGAERRWGKYNVLMKMGRTGGMVVFTLDQMPPFNSWIRYKSYDTPPEVVSSDTVGTRAEEEERSRQYVRQVTHKSYISKQVERHM